MRVQLIEGNIILEAPVNLNEETLKFKALYPNLEVSYENIKQHVYNTNRKKADAFPGLQVLVLD